MHRAQDRTITRWGRLPAWWLLHPGIDADRFCVLAALATYADEDGCCRPSQATLAHHLGRSRPWVNRVVAELARDGFLRKTLRARENGGTTSCLYRLALEPSAMHAEAVTTATPPCPERDAPRHGGDGNQTNPDQHTPAPRAQPTPMTACLEDAPTGTGVLPAPDWQPSADALARAGRAFPDVPTDEHVPLFVARCRAKGYRYRPGALDDAWLSWFLEDARRDLGRRAGRRGDPSMPWATHGTGDGRVGRAAPSERADARLAAWAAAAAAPRLPAAGPWS